MDRIDDQFIEYEPLIELHNAGDRVLLRSILDAEKITYFIQGEYAAPYLFHALPMRVMVRKDQYLELQNLKFNPLF